MKTNVIEDYLVDSMDEVMHPYTDSDDYKATREAISNSMREFKSGLSQAQQKKFNRLMDMVNDADAQFASKAFVYGAVNGIALREQILDNK